MISYSHGMIFAARKTSARCYSSHRNLIEDRRRCETQDGRTKNTNSSSPRKPPVTKRLKKKVSNQFRILSNCKPGCKVSQREACVVKKVSVDPLSHVASPSPAVYTVTAVTRLRVLQQQCITCPVQLSIL